MTNNSKETIVIGAGGHGKVVVSLLQELGFSISRILDDDRSKWGSSILDVPVNGSIDVLYQLQVSSAILGIGNNTTRLALARKFAEKVSWITAVHPYSFIHSSVTIGEGTVVFAGSIIQPGTVIGKHCIVNTGATVDHDCIIKDGTHIAPGCHLAGSVSVGENVFFGIGASVIPGCSIGQNTVVGAGATVVSNLPGNVVAVGIPAKPIGKIEETRHL